MAAPLPGIDADQPLNGALVARAGKRFAARYMGRHPSGDLTIAEAKGLIDAGVGILLLYEFSTNDLGTKPSAFQCAVTAVQDAANLEAPRDGSVGSVLCEDNVNPDVGAVESDMAGAAKVLRSGGLLAIFYGRKEIARNLIRSGAIDGTFVVDTWGSDEPGDLWNFRQLPNAGSTTIGGVTCDIDDAPNPIGLWGQHFAPPVPPPPPTVHPITGDPDVSEEITESCVLEKDPSGPGSAGWFTVGVFADHILAVNVGGEDVVATGDYVEFDEPTWEQIATGITRVQIVSPSPEFIGKTVTCTVVLTTGTVAP